MNAGFFTLRAAKKDAAAENSPAGPAGESDTLPTNRQEVRPNWHNGLRQIHRWLSIVFTATVIVTTVALAQEKPVVWVSYVPLFPLALLLLTGLYLFVQPYVARWRSGQRSNG